MTDLRSLKWDERSLSYAPSHLRSSRICSLHPLKTRHQHVDQEKNETLEASSSHHISAFTKRSHHITQPCSTNYQITLEKNPKGPSRQNWPGGCSIHHTAKGRDFLTDQPPVLTFIYPFGRWALIYSLESFQQTLFILIGSLDLNLKLQILSYYHELFYHLFICQYSNQLVNIFMNMINSWKNKIDMSWGLLTFRLTF